MSNSLGTFFWLSFVFMFAKTKVDLPRHAYVVFLLVIMIFMYFINVSILQEHCGTVSSWTVLKATLFPWIFIFANMMYVLGKFPWWKRPFSNTFGLLLVKLAGCNAAFLAILKPMPEGSALHYVYTDPSLLVNRFTLENFDATVVKLSHLIDPTKTKEIQAFKQFVKMKDIIAEWIWYLLTASVAISISYNTLMFNKCTKTKEQYTETHNNAVANTQEEVKPAVYNVSE